MRVHHVLTALTLAALLLLPERVQAQGFTPSEFRRATPASKDEAKRNVDRLRRFIPSIIGGVSRLSPGEFPHQVSLMYHPSSTIRLVSIGTSAGDPLSRTNGS